MWRHTPKLPAVREYQELLQRYAPDHQVNYTSFEEFLGAKCWWKDCRAGPNPSRGKLLEALESISAFDLGGITVNYSPRNRVGSRYVEVTVIGSTGKLLK